jgi:hypothetical protein
MAHARPALERGPQQTAANLRLKPLDRLVGRWTSESTHPALPGVTVSGTLVAEWLEGGHFLMLRTRNDHPDLPDSVSIVGFSDVDREDDAPEDTAARRTELSLHYYDSRGVSRVYEALVDGESWRLWRNAPELSQTFVGEFSDDGDTVLGLWRTCRDGAVWQDDLRVVYRRE